DDRRRYCRKIGEREILRLDHWELLRCAVFGLGDRVGAQLANDLIDNSPRLFLDEPMPGIEFDKLVRTLHQCVTSLHAGAPDGGVQVAPDEERRCGYISERYAGRRRCSGVDAG